jgi:HPt (histidine-containing phosphotransfer) domain-containing protein
MSRQDFETLQQLARVLKGEAGGYGFEPITSAAHAVEESAKAASDIDKLKTQVDELVHLCRMARPISE